MAFIEAYSDSIIIELDNNGLRKKPEYKPRSRGTLQKSPCEIWEYGVECSSKESLVSGV